MTVRFTLAGIRRGYVRATPLALSTIVYGFTFGVLAAEAKLSTLEAVLMSAVVYSGSAQLAALQGWSLEKLLLPLMATILVVNARYMLYGATLRPWLGGLPASRVYPSLFLMGDHNWALAMSAHAEGEDDAGFLFGSGLAMFVPWTLGTLIGHLGGAAVADPARFGLDFMLVALAAGMAIAFWRGRVSLMPGLVALAVALALHRFVSAGWVVVAAGLAGGAVAFVTHDDRR